MLNAYNMDATTPPILFHATSRRKEKEFWETIKTHLTYKGRLYMLHENNLKCLFLFLQFAELIIVVNRCLSAKSIIFGGG